MTLGTVGTAARMRLHWLLALALALMLLAPAGALADGDPGSDVLLNQNLFTATDSDVSIAQQLQLGRLLDVTAAAGAPIRVAIVSHEDDLGTVTALWGKPQTYANYLGDELAGVYTGRLLIVMPSGYGVHWQADPSGAARLVKTLSGNRPTAGTPAALTAGTTEAVDQIEASAGISVTKLAKLGSAPATSGLGVGPGTSSGTPVSGAGTATSADNTSRHRVPGGLLLVVIVVLLALYVAWRTGRLRGLRGRTSSLRGRLPRPGEGWRAIRIRPVALLPSLLLVIVVAALVINHSGSQPVVSKKVALATNPHIDPGTMLRARVAPGFKLTDQTGQTVSLKQYRGKVVILSFIDAECQTICPLTSAAMLDAKAALGKSGNQVQLLGVDANWRSTQVEDVLNYTDLHGMTGEWNFLTGSLGQLQHVWTSYGINEQALESKTSNVIDHVAALYVIDPEGRIRQVYTTYPSYASVPQMGQLLAQRASALLPDHPAVKTHYSYAERPETNPTQKASVPRLGGGAVELGPGRAHLYLFFATWDTQTTPIARELDELNVYDRQAKAKGLPSITAIDEGSVEPSAATLPKFIRTLADPLTYPVAIDRTGSVGDGYDVEGEPWFVLTDAAGKIVWYQEVYTAGWPNLKRLDQEVANDLSSAPAKAPGTRQSDDDLVGSPAALSNLHAQASKVLAGGQPALDARIRQLESRGYSVVLNIWGSWCEPCQAEFSEFAKASVQYGKRVAFLGADDNDPGSNGQIFLNQHHVSYPSYETTSTSIDKILVGGLEGTPTTVYLLPDGDISHENEGPYTSVGALDSDIQDYAINAASK